MRKLAHLILLSLILAGISAGCGPAERSGDAAPIRLALLPILDTLPAHVAAQEGLFDQEKIKVEFIPVGSGAERDQLIASAQADGMVNEMISTLFFNKEGVRVQTVRLARSGAQGEALFSVLTGADSPVETVQDLVGRKVAVADGTIIAYVTERILEQEGMTPADVRFLSVPKIDARLALLGSGGADAVVLPEPLASLAVSQGARKVIDDTSHPQYAFSTWTLRKEFLDQHPQEVKAFLRALQKAVDHINQDPARYSALMVELKLLPKPLEGWFEVPRFVGSEIPTRADFEDALAWARAKGYIDAGMRYEDSVTPAFLP